MEYSAGASEYKYPIHLSEQREMSSSITLDIDSLAISDLVPCLRCLNQCKLGDMYHYFETGALPAISETDFVCSDCDTYYETFLAHLASPS